MARPAYDTFRHGTELLDKGKAAEASVLLEQAKEEEPNKASIREALARAYYNSGNVEAATHNFMKALTIDPVNDFAHFGVALCLERRGEYEPALGHVKMALAMRPDNEKYRRAGLRLEIKTVRAP